MSRTGSGETGMARADPGESCRPTGHGQGGDLDLLNTEVKSGYKGIPQKFLHLPIGLLEL